MEKIEITPIAISLNQYNRHIAELVEHLLKLDDKMSSRTNIPEVA